jgi:hypothetical protein
VFGLVARSTHQQSIHITISPQRQTNKSLNSHCEASLCVMSLATTTQSPCCCIKHSFSGVTSCVEMPRECYTFSPM